MGVLVVVVVLGGLFLEQILSVLLSHEFVWFVEFWFIPSICRNRKVLFAEFVGSFGKFLLFFMVCVLSFCVFWVGIPVFGHKRGLIHADVAVG